MNGSEYGVVLFYSTSGALRAEKLARRHGLEVRLIPVPRQLSSDCGMSLRFELARCQEIERILAQAGVEWQRICKL